MWLLGLENKFIGHNIENKKASAYIVNYGLI